MERMRKAAAAAMVALAGALMMSGCTSDSDTGAVEPSEVPAAQAIVGTWYHCAEGETDCTIAEYTADGQWTVSSADTLDSDTFGYDFGTYKVEGDTFTFLTDNFCEDAPGTYTLAFDGDQLTRTLVNDECAERRMDIAEGDPSTRLTK
jgi:hypothetical protein